MEIFLKAATATTIVFPLLAAGSATRKSSATLAAGDFKVCLHTGGTWSVANAAGTVPTEIGTTGIYALPLTAGELTPDDQQYPVVVACHDASGSEWDDQSILIRLWDTDIEGLPGTAAIGTAVDAVLGAAHGTGSWGQASGAGAVAQVIRVNDEGGDPLDGVSVWATTDSGGAAVVASGTTNASGLVTLYLDAGTYYFWKQLVGKNFTNPQLGTVT